MAIGFSRMMGIRLPDNFLMPYSSINISEFWRRWHVSLSTWFRDYLFLPSAYRISNAIKSDRVLFWDATSWAYVGGMMLTMLLCGLWHGPSWNFVFWGALHGTALATHRIWTGGRRPRRVHGSRSLWWLRSLGSRCLTLGVVSVGWIFFRAESWPVAVEYLKRLATWRGDGIALDSPYIVPLSVFVFLVHLVVSKDRNLVEEMHLWPAPVRVFAYATMLLALTLLVPSEAVPFVYSNF